MPSLQKLTRFAPSPTGLLHLGHVAHAAWVWGLAELRGYGVLIRMEDHDQGRCRAEYEQAALADLTWLGFRPESESLASLARRPSLYRQSDCHGVYRAAADALEAQGLVYGCSCSRATIAQVADQDGPAGERRYPGTCREGGLRLGPGIGLRLKMPDEEVVIHDERLGRRVQNPARHCGDILIRDRLGNWTYQFAVVVDDLRHGVGLVIRGEDLIDSVARQVVIGAMLGASRPPTYHHHPLVRGASGVKLSKADGATGVRELKDAGWRPAQVIGAALAAIGLCDLGSEVSQPDIPALLARTGGQDPLTTSG